MPGAKELLAETSGPRDCARESPSTTPRARSIRLFRICAIFSRKFHSAGTCLTRGHASSAWSCSITHCSLARTSADRTHRRLITALSTPAARILQMLIMATSPKQSYRRSRSISHPFRLHRLSPDASQNIAPASSPARVTKCSDCTTRGCSFSAISFRTMLSTNRPFTLDTLVRKFIRSDTVSRSVARCAPGTKLGLISTCLTTASASTWRRC
mmetsp:Transcript_4004/g.9652  ORF Transcript_4004/g.9652 Transcript_4004/m.9652 type:complete len:213 (+) Transcript_4004:124-762(+)